MSDPTGGRTVPVVNLRAPAKLNLGLKIVGRRKDGYHTLSSLFVPVGLYDNITVRESTDPSDVFYSSASGETLDFPNDTVSRVFTELKKEGLKHPNVRVSIKKVIPTGAGLGGGSSDAGVILSHLISKYFPNLDVRQAEVIALRIGADVPFFLHKRPAWVRGIGEIIEPVSVDPFAVVIVRPPFGVETQKAFSWFDKESSLTQLGADVTTAMIDGVGFSGPRVVLDDLVRIMENDLEKVVEKRHPEIRVLKEALRQRGALGSLMSGSGSSVYGVFKSLSDAVTARETLQPLFPSEYAFFNCEALV